MKLNMKVKVIAAVGLMMALTLGISLISQSSLTDVRQTTVAVKNGSGSRILKIQKINTQYVETQTNLLTFFTASNEEERQTVKEAQKEIFQQLIKVTEAYRDSATEKEDSSNAEKLLDLADSYSNYFESYLKGNVDVSDVTKAGEKVGLLLNEMITENATSSNRQQTSLIKTADKANRSIKIGNVVVVLVAIAMAFNLVWIIVIPIERVKKQLDTIIKKLNRNKFDTNDRIYIKSKDEIGIMVDNINLLIEKMGNVLLLISEDSNKLINSVKVVSGKVTETNTSVGESSAAMEELAASMQEIAVATQELTGNSDEIYGQMVKIADNAKDGSAFASKLMKEAKASRKQANNSKVETKDVIEEISSDLLKSINNSKQVDKIDELTEEILSISAQTNLLALNASIEAARAGEAGKGFSVVADEIRELADTSKETANTIQEISKLVQKAVHKLSSDSSKMIEFIEKTVMGDYDNFVAMAAHYYDGVHDIDKMFHDFSKMSTELQETMQTVDHSIHLIADTIEESSGTINSVADNATDMVSAMEGVTGEMKVSEEVSKALLGEVKKFIN